MIPELGHFALILALMVAMAQMHPRLSRRAAFLQFSLCLAAFLALMWAYVTSDFTVLNVAENSHTLKPLLYKIAGVWGNHEGSMLLWVLMLSLFGMLVTINPPLPSGERKGVRGRKNSEPKKNHPLTLALSPRGEETKALQIMGALGFGFIAYTLFASNPFMRIDPPPFDGMGLNPVLQDMALAIHPPLLYMGYVGFSVAFAFAVAALWQGELDKDFAKRVKPWIMLAWTSLTAGIALGSYWAYYELGWGGWWFWDPVENSSLMPWLLGTALLHSVIVLEKRGALKRWTVLLCILTFSLSILGTFLVRSGVLTSVHAFAVDPLRGSFILALLAIYTGGALTLYARRATSLKTSATFAPVSRESALVLNNLFLATMTATVLIGTLYPLILSALDKGQISIGPPYFHATFVPIAVPMLILMAISPFIPWKNGSVKFIIQSMKRAFTTKPQNWSMLIAHAGLGVAVIGMVSTALFTKDNIAVLEPGQKMNVGHYELTLKDVTPVFGANYSAIKATVEARRNNKTFTLYPENRYYPIEDKNTTEAAIALSLGGDIYVVLGGHDDQGWVITAKTHPYIGFLWLGFIAIALGGLASLTRGRLWDAK